MLFAQGDHLVGIEPRKGEHTGLTGGKGEVHAELFAGGGERRAHAVDAAAHARDFVNPGGLEFGVVEDFAHGGGTVRGRVGVFGTNDGLDDGLDHDGFAGVRGHDVQTAGAFAVETEVLRAGGGDHEGETFGGEEARRKGVLVKAAAEALVGDVEEREEISFLDDFDHFLPLFMREVHTRRVVAAGVKENNRADIKRLEGGLHGIEVHETRCLVVVRILGHFETGVLEERDVVAPGRIGDDGLLKAEHVMREDGTQTQSARAAKRLDRADAPGENRFGFGAEDELLNGAAVGGQAGHRDVAVGSAAVNQTLFRFGNRLHERKLAFFVKEDTDAEIDLFRTRVILEEFVEAENGIIGRGLQRGKNLGRHG